MLNLYFNEFLLFFFTLLLSKSGKIIFLFVWINEGLANLIFIIVAIYLLFRAKIKDNLLFLQLINIIIG